MPRRRLIKKAPKSNVVASRRIASRKREVAIGRRTAIRNRLGVRRGSPKRK